MKRILAFIVSAALLVLVCGSICGCGRKGAEAVDFPDGMHWLCTNCQHGFSTPREVFADWVQDHPDQPLECPECHENSTVVARHCPLCEKYYTQPNTVIDGKVCCPVCKQPLP